jgi:hypothetical protein
MVISGRLELPTNPFSPALVKACSSISASLSLKVMLSPENISKI